MIVLADLFPHMPAEHEAEALRIYGAIFGDLPLDTWQRQGSLHCTLRCFAQLPAAATAFQGTNAAVPQQVEHHVYVTFLAAASGTARIELVAVNVRVQACQAGFLSRRGRS